MNAQDCTLPDPSLVYCSFGAIHDVRARCRCRRRRDRVVPQILHLLHCRGRGSQIIARRGAAVQVPVRIRRVVAVRHDGLRAVRAAGIALPFRLIAWWLLAVWISHSTRGLS